MYDIRQFKPSLYLLLMVGISGFALAARTPGLWLLGMAGLLANAWLVRIGRFRPMPRIIANVVTLLIVGYIIQELRTSAATPVLVIGQFLVLMQLVKAWEQRANRDYAQLLILSLLLMVAASITTASLWFGILLVLYLFLSLYCCLLFHLKVETDQAKASLAVPEEKLSPNTLKQDQRYLPRSMRRLTAFVSVVAVAFAVFVFVFFPRGSGAGMLGPVQAFRSSASLTGFSDQMSFQDVARIQQNHERVAFVKLWHNDLPASGQDTLMLRGLSLDTYRKPRRPGGAWEWERTMPPDYADVAEVGRPLIFPGAGDDRWRQQITLFPTHSVALFALAGPVEFRSVDSLKVRHSPDGTLEMPDKLNEKISYEVISTGSLDAPPGVASGASGPSAARVRANFARIFQYARRPEVSGIDAAGASLAEQRLALGRVGPLDARIAENIERYLRANFAYTLDLTDEKSLRGRDPLEAFLYDWKKGHCEYFASAMTLMCQSLGLQARVVIGFKCTPDEYNNFSGLYTVLQSDAHSWVEVKTAAGWRSYDPTSSRGAARSGGGLLTRARHLLEYVEYTYANAVIAYDTQTRDSLLGSVETNLGLGLNKGANLLSDIGDFFQSSTFWSLSSAILTGIVMLMLGVVALSFGWFIWERWQLRRRAARIGIESLPEAEQLRLARQLGFYDDLLRLLDRQRIARPAHYTPREFSRSLTFLPADAYDTIQRLTGLFYKVRYGGTELPPQRRRRLGAVLSRLADELAG